MKVNLQVKVTLTWKKKWQHLCQHNRQCTHNVTCNHRCNGKALSIAYSECVFVALGIWHAFHMCHIVICACPALQYLSTLSHEQNDFCKKAIEQKMCFNFLYLFSWNISHSKKNWARHDQKYILVFIQNNCYSCHILMKPEFSWQIFEKYSSIVTKICPMEAKLCHADRQMDRHDEANCCFS